MKKLRDFLKTEHKVIFSCLLVIMTFGCIFLFANLNKEYFLLGSEITIFGLIVYLFFAYFNYKKEQTLKEKFNELYIKNKKLENQIIVDRNDLEEYFLLWVHQIKTPITVSNLIFQKSDFKEVKRLKEQMFFIEEYTNMAINYLKLKDRQSDMDITNVDLDKIIKSILKKYSMLFIDKKISLNYTPIKENIISDYKWLSILIEQIICNAIKYTDTGEISIYYDNVNNTLCIKDTGVGIRSEDIHKIFDRGYSGFNGRINEKSSGLGLYLVKSIAVLLNLKINVKSVLYKGTTFFIEFKTLQN